MEGRTGGVGRPSVRVSASSRGLSLQTSIAAAEASGQAFKVMPHKLSREGSIAAAEAAGQAFKVMPHVFFSAHKLAAALELGQLAVEATQKQIDYARRRSAALSAVLVERDVANLAARGESIDVVELCARVEARQSQNFDVARHFLERGRGSPSSARVPRGKGTSVCF